MKNKVLTVSLIILVCITLIGVVALILVMQLNKGDEEKEPTIDEIIESRSMLKKLRQIWGQTIYPNFLENPDG